jgi:hypothetical protein
MVGMGRAAREVKVARRVVRNAFVLYGGGERLALCVSHWQDGGMKGLKRNILILRKPRPFLQIRPRAKATINLTRQDHRPRRPPLVHARRATHHLRRRHLRPVSGVLGVHGVDVLSELHHQLPGDGVSCRRSVEAEDADAPCRGGGDVRYGDAGRVLGGGSGGGVAADEEVEERGGGAWARERTEVVHREGFCWAVDVGEKVNGLGR